MEVEPEAKRCIRIMKNGEVVEQEDMRNTGIDGQNAKGPIEKVNRCIPRVRHWSKEERAKPSVRAVDDHEQSQGGQNALNSLQHRGSGEAEYQRSDAVKQTGTLSRSISFHVHGMTRMLLRLPSIFLVFVRCFVVAVGHMRHGSWRPGA